MGAGTPTGKGRISRCTSAPVITPTTPGRARAACASMRRMRAWAYGLRTSAATLHPGNGSRSSMKCPAPRIRRSSSTRQTGRPIQRNGSAIMLVLRLDKVRGAGCHSVVSRRLLRGDVPLLEILQDLLPGTPGRWAIAAARGRVQPGHFSPLQHVAGALAQDLATAIVVDELHVVATALLAAVHAPGQEPVAAKGSRDARPLR